MALAQRERVAAPPAVRPTPVSERATKLNRQADPYTFPHHHLPHFDAHGGATAIRSLSRGLEYLCCLRHLSLLIEELDASSLLDVGCGDARLFQMLPPNVTRRLGIDLSERAIAFARAFNPRDEFRVGSADAVREQFELVTAVDVLQHIPDDGVSGFLRSVDARVAPGGHAIIAAPSVVLPLDAKHFRHYDERVLRNQVKESGARLHIVSIEHVYKHRSVAHRWLDLLENRLWTIDAKPLRRFTWNLVWNRLRMGNARNGRHVVAVLRKI
ncbi:MAG TPA: class I SAM-dependent methyltransferase [Gemmatimonadaceae bacterium]|nr:class I SAM-dependent methyltransferase [Gemmatimonadaceae bacterium]